jgi:hypothetical protein
VYNTVVQKSVVSLMQRIDKLHILSCIHLLEWLQQHQPLFVFSYFVLIN